MIEKNNLTQSIKTLCEKSSQAAQLLSQLSSDQKQQALLAMADQVEKHRQAILDINQKEVKQAKKNNLSSAFLDRLILSKSTIDAMINGIKKIADMPDPVGRIMDSWTVDSGLKLSRVAIPIGVLAIIYESRPNVTADAAALCMQSGNACILRGGSDCGLTNQKIAECLQKGLETAGITQNAIQYIPTQDRTAVDILLQMDEYIDVIIPRGGKALIKHIQDHSRIPIFSHLEGLCHTYIHEAAQLDMAINIILNAKMRRTGICGATETILIDQSIASHFLPPIINVLIEKGCEIRGDQSVQNIDPRVKLACTKDWATEYLDAIISIKAVDDINDAIKHITQYSTHHTEAIVTDNKKAADLFKKSINSAIVMHNCSTQFADGGEFGMGAEIGISTGKLHARGPVGANQLTTFKYIVEGQGQTRP